MLAVEVGGIDRGVTALVEQLRRPAEQLSPHAHRRSLEHLAQCRRRGKLPAPKTEQQLDALHLLGPVDDFLVLGIHVLAEVEQNSVLPAGKPVAG